MMGESWLIPLWLIPIIWLIVDDEDDEQTGGK